MRVKDQNKILPFSMLDVEQFSELHSGGFWDFDELTNFKQFQSSTKQNPDRQGLVQKTMGRKKRQKQRFPPRKSTRKDIIQDILHLLS